VGLFFIRTCLKTSSGISGWNDVSADFAETGRGREAHWKSPRREAQCVMTGRQALERPCSR
jgi:hypothetical protein